MCTGAYLHLWLHSCIAQGGKRRELDPLGLELTTIWVLGIKPRPSRRRSSISALSLNSHHPINAYGILCGKISCTLFFFLFVGSRVSHLPGCLWTITWNLTALRTPFPNAEMSCKHHAYFCAVLGKHFYQLSYYTLKHKTSSEIN